MDAIRYRIYTEDIQGTEDIAAQHFSAFTIMKTRGYFRGEPEHSIIIEIVGCVADRPLVNKVARIIREKNEQRLVLVTSDNVDLNLIER